MSRLLFLFVFASITMAYGDTPPTPTSPERTVEQIDSWIEALSDPKFQTRRRAAIALRDTGIIAVPRVGEAITSAQDAEVQRSGFTMLAAWLRSPQPAVSSAARHCLKELVKSENHKIAGKAAGVLAEQQLYFARWLIELGCIVSVEDGDVTVVRCDGRRVTNDHMRLMNHFPELRELSVGETNIGDAGLAHLVGLEKLVYLNLYRTQVSNAGLAHLKKIRTLQSIPMGHTHVTDAGLLHLLEMPQLQYVGLRGNNITDEGMLHLKNLTNLTGIYLGETKITDVGLERIQHMIQMEYIRLHDTMVTDRGLETLKSFQNLRKVSIGDTKVTEQGLQVLRKTFPDLQITP